MTIRPGGAGSLPHLIIRTIALYTTLCVNDTKQARMPPRLDLIVRVGRQARRRQARRRPARPVAVRPLRRHPVRRRSPIRNVGVRGKIRRRCGRRLAARTRLDVLLLAASYSG
ncbi:hypothetical protein EAF00_008119 [Botryotinia globosa]|nr:hypothetical protein EAF00_008119 [Botryotinia globosa]